MRVAAIPNALIIQKLGGKKHARQWNVNCVMPWNIPFYAQLARILLRAITFPKQIVVWGV
jgi:hypothetical protein